MEYLHTLNPTSLDEAQLWAKRETEKTGVHCIGIDSGPNCWPRYRVVVAPIIGDPVSYGFNGDYYPCGHIVSITPETMRIIKTDTGEVFYRRKNSNVWVLKGGTWVLTHGHINEWNRSF